MNQPHLELHQSVDNALVAHIQQDLPSIIKAVQRMEKAGNQVINSLEKMASAGEKNNSEDERTNNVF